MREKQNIMSRNQAEKLCYFKAVADIVLTFYGYYADSASSKIELYFCSFLSKMICWEPRDFFEGLKQHEKNSACGKALGELESFWPMDNSLHNSGQDPRSTCVTLPTALAFTILSVFRTSSTFIFPVTDKITITKRKLAPMMLFSVSQRGCC